MLTNHYQPWLNTDMTNTTTHNVYGTGTVLFRYATCVLVRFDNGFTVHVAPETLS